MRRSEQGRGLRAVVFVDTVASTRIAAELGDARWQALLRRELQTLRHLLKERGGLEVDVAGDGLFALFREPAPAVRFAASAAEAVREIGLEIRAGVHFGEVEFADDRPGGIVVHTGARAMAVGDAGDVIVTQGVRDLLTGGHLAFTDHGIHALKGVPGTWPLFRLSEIDDTPVGTPPREEDASARREDASQPVPLVKRRRFLVGAGVTLVAGGSTATYLLSRNQPTRKTEHTNLGGERVLRYVPETDDLATMPGVYSSTGFLPSIAVGEGAVWSGDYYLHHVDPDDGSERAPILLLRGESEFVYGITIGFDDVWVATGSGLYRIDPGDDEVLGFQDVPGGASTVAIGFGSVWTGNWGGTLSRVEPSRRLPILKTLLVGDVVSGVVEAAGAIWVSDEFGELIAVDPKRERIVDRVRVGGAPKALAATEDRLWAVDPQASIVKVVDLQTRTPRRDINVGGEPVDVAAGLGAVWVADLEGRLVKVDETILDVVDEVPMEGPVAAIAIDEEHEVIWLRTTHR